MNKFKNPANSCIDKYFVQHLHVVLLIHPQVDPEPVTTAKTLRARFSRLLQGEQVNNEAMNMTSGQMLLMGFNGLFTRLEADFSTMMDAITNLHHPDAWRKVDIVREGKGLQVYF